MLNLDAINATIQKLQDQAAVTEGTEASAGQVIGGFSATLKAEIQKALDADNAADQGTVNTVNATIDAVTARFQASAKGLGDAIAANNPNPVG